jgi:hypothetical protein
MNYIVSIYLTSGPDVQRGNIFKEPDDPEYIKSWYDSVIHLNLNGIILHDGLSEKFISNYSKVNFIKVAPCGKFQLYDYIWILYCDFIKKIPFENIFFTDLWDIKVIQDPFIHPVYNDYTIFCGDVNSGVMRGDYFIGGSLQNKILMNLSEFEEIITSDRRLLNNGTIGGSRKMIKRFINILCDVILKMKDRELDITCDMSIFNYVMYKFFVDEFYAGFPVCSGFKKYEDRNDVWFIHK